MVKGWLTVVVWCAGVLAAEASVRVSAEADKSSLHVGERVLITVTATRPTHGSEPIPSHAGLQLGPEWDAGSQTAETERPDSAGYVKTWRFELIARAETISTITPVVILGIQSSPEAPIPTNRVLGPPVTVTIKPERVRPWWIPHPRTLAILAGIAVAAFAIVRSIRRRAQNAPRPTLTPLQQALAMMEEVHANCREDRAPRFFADVERVLTGYLSRRMNRPLRSATASEVATMSAHFVSDSQTIADLLLVLQRCATVRFSGAGADYRQLAETEELALSVLERLDAQWVTDTPEGATSAGDDRT